MRTTIVVAASLLLSACVIANAFCLKKQFYPSLVYICQSNPSMAVMYLQALIAVYLLGKLTCKIFFGPLRAAESEHLFEKICHTLIETCLTFAYFHDDFGPKFITQFICLLFLKCFHWLTEDRVDYMERTPFISYLFHMRIWLLLTLLTWADIYFAYEAYTILSAEGGAIQFVFGFEYILLITTAANSAFKYILHALDAYSDTFWGNKAVILLYIEFLIGSWKTIIYMYFLVIMIKINIIPYFALQPTYLAYSDFVKALQDILLSRRAIHFMNTLFPDATIQDLQTIENLCIICRENMTVTDAKKLPCNHIFHTSCLCSWFQRHQTCPICRADILSPRPSTQPLASAAVPPHARTAQDAAAASHSSPNMNDINNHGPSTSHRPNLLGQVESNDNLYYNQTSLQNQFRPYAFSDHSSISDESYSDSSDDYSNDSLSQQNDRLESPTPLVNAEELDAGLPSFFQNMLQADANPPTIPINMPFVGSTGIPLPTIPANLNDLSDEELHLMEQNTRQACLARLKYLTDIKCMLNAATVMMNHYSTACLIAGTESTNNGPSDETRTSNVTENNEQSDIRPPSNTLSDNGSSSESSSSSSGSDDHLLPQEETELQRFVRLKRLEKFDNTGNNST